MIETRRSAPPLLAFAMSLGPVMVGVPPSSSTPDALPDHSQVSPYTHVQTPPPPSTFLFDASASPAGDSSPDQLDDSTALAALLAAGFPEDELPRGLALIKASTGGRTTINQSLPDGYRVVGPLAISTIHQKLIEKYGDPQNIESAAKIARAIIKTQGYGAWPAGYLRDADLDVNGARKATNAYLTWRQHLPISEIPTKAPQPSSRQSSRPEASGSSTPPSTAPSSASNADQNATHSPQATVPAPNPTEDAPILPSSDNAAVSNRAPDGHAVRANPPPVLRFTALSLGSLTKSQASQQVPLSRSTSRSSSTNVTSSPKRPEGNDTTRGPEHVSESTSRQTDSESTSPSPSPSAHAEEGGTTIRRVPDVTESRNERSNSESPEVGAEQHGEAKEGDSTIRRVPDVTESYESESDHSSMGPLDVGIEHRAEIREGDRTIRRIPDSEHSKEELNDFTSRDHAESEPGSRRVRRVPDSTFDETEQNWVSKDDPPLRTGTVTIRRVPDEIEVRRRKHDRRQTPEDSHKDSRRNPPHTPPVPPKPSRPNPPPGTGVPPLIHPVPGAIKTSDFGYRTNPVNGQSELHAGTDFAAPGGTPIKSAASGVVDIAGWVGGYGKYTCVKHTVNASTCYGHQNEIHVKKGDSVEQGKHIGDVGTTGQSTGNHLHFELKINGAPVNAAPYLGL